MTNVIQELQKRGLIDAMTQQNLDELTEKPQKIYVGFDPTADSLHIGNLVPIIVMRWFQKYGHQPIAVVGGATGMVGDPSGKSTERNLLDKETLEKNLEGIQKDLKRVLDFDSSENPALIVNNFDWFKNFSFIDFIRDVGKNFRMGPMLAKESVRSRLNSEEGMSFTEFSYQLLQAYDFLYLYDEMGVTLQVGGSDQWGNITAGTDLIRKLRSKEAYGLTLPLLTRSDGKKFGKSESGAIFMSPEHCSAFDFYQYFFRVPDADVIHLMKTLTFMDLEEIQAIAQSMQESAYKANTAQRILAERMTLLIHGQEGLDSAKKATEGMRPGGDAKLDLQVLESLSGEVPTFTLESDQVVIGSTYADLAVATKFLSSKGEGRRLIQNGGAYLNNEKISDPARLISKEDLIGGKVLLLGSGKKKKMIVRVEEKKK